MPSRSHLTLYKGSLFAYIGELRIPVNRVPLVNYTGWSITGRFEDHTGAELFILNVAWVDITTGLFEFNIPVAPQIDLKKGRDYRLYITPETPAGEQLPPMIITVSVQDLGVEFVT